jgi:PAS domain S-box-containing protein
MDHPAPRVSSRLGRRVAAYVRRVSDSRVVGVHFDVTDRRLAEAALRESEARFREMADAAPTLIWVADGRGRATFFNEQWLAFTGRTMEQEHGEGWVHDVHPDDVVRYRVAFRDALAARESFEIEFRLRHAGGDYRWVLARGSPLFHEGGRFGGFVGSGIDINERRRTNEAMRLLADISSELAASLEPERISTALAEILVPRFADWCTVSRAAADGSISPGAAHHRHPEGEALLTALDAYGSQGGEGSGIIAQVMATGEHVFIPEVDEGRFCAWARGSHHLHLLRSLQLESVIGVPLIARGRTLGALVLSRGATSTRYDQADVALALEVARRAALAIDNADLYRESQRREAGMRRANDALQFLADAGIELNRSLDHRETLTSIARLAVPRFADLCAVDVIEPGGALRRAGFSASDELQAQAAPLMSGVDTRTRASQKLVERLSRGEAILIGDANRLQLHGYGQLPEHLQALRTLDAHSIMIVPLLARGTALGAISFVRARPGEPYDSDDLHVAEQLGRRAGLSLDNSRLYSEARAIEASLRRSNELIRFVADASAEMADNLDYEESLRRLAGLAVPQFADWCAVDILEPAGGLKRIAAIHSDPAMVKVANDLAECHPADMSADSASLRLLRTGESVLYREISDETVSGFATREPGVRFMRKLGLKSAMVVALSSRSRVFGSLTFGVGDAARRYNEADLAMAEELARRAGIAVENARLYTEGLQREKDLVRANEAKDEFLGLMSHELRTPITVIHGGARVLRARASMLNEETRDDMLGDIERESERLARMLENLLALARVELDQETTVEPVLVQRLVKRIIDSAGSAAGSRQIDFQTDPNLPAVAAEPSYFEHVVRNLISNAEKYSPPGQPIEVRLSHDNGKAAIRVMDRGFGIAPDETERIFERFYRSDRTAKLAGGAGMGLAVCKRLIEAMGGHIWATPREGGGLEAGFSLPFYEEDEL